MKVDMDAKRLFDVILSAIVLLILLPVLMIIYFCVLFKSGRPVIYRQERIGRNGKRFVLYKFRTMDYQAVKNGMSCTFRDDIRITNVGKYLRKYKLDEIPQLFNILKGDMSFVGPRPELPKFIKFYPDAYNKILKIKPGLTDLASIKFRNENKLLDNYTGNNIEEVYIAKILPQKLKYNLEYLGNQSFFYDLGLIFRTVYAVIFKIP